MPILLRPFGDDDDDYSNVEHFAEGSLPQVLSGRTAGNWRVGRVAWGSTEIVVTDPVGFTARSSRFDDTDRVGTATLSVAGSQEGTFSGWLYVDGTWNSPSMTMFEVREGTNIRFRLYTASTGRMSIALSPATVYTSPTSSFEGGRWHHVAVSYKSGSGGWYQISIDGAAPINGPDLTSVTLNIETTLTRCYVGATGGSSPWVGDLGHLYFNVQEALDLSDAANRAKLIAGGAPVNMGTNGQLVTGTAPAFYIDGGAAIENFGTGGAVPVTSGTITAGATPALP